MSRLMDKCLLTDPFFTSLSPLERLCYLGLILIAEGTGCFEYNPRALRNLIFPDPKDRISPKRMEKMIGKFILDKKLLPYGDGNFLYIKNFFKYQGQSKCPKPRLPLPPWLDWEGYPDKPYLGRVVFKGEVDYPGKLVLPCNNPPFQKKKMTHECQLDVPSMEDECKEGQFKPSLNQENLCRTPEPGRAVARINRIEKKRKNHEKDSLNKNLSFSEKGIEDSSFSGNTSFFPHDRSKNVYLKERGISQEFCRNPSKEYNYEFLPKLGSKIREEMEEFLKTHVL